MPASTNGGRNDVSTPVLANGNGPSSFSPTHPFSAFNPSATRRSSHTIETSSSVPATQKNSPFSAHAGTLVLAGSWHTTSRCGRRRYFNLCGNRTRRVQQPLGARYNWFREHP